MCIKKSTILLAILLLCISAYSRVAPSTYDGIKQSGIYSITVTENGATDPVAVFKNDCPKYSLGFENMEAKDKAPFTLFKDRGINWSKFNFGDSITVKVTVTNTTKVPVSGQTVKVWPSRHGVSNTVKGNTITFTITEPGQYSVEIGENGYKNGLILFADPLETDIPSKTDPSYLLLDKASTSSVASIANSSTGIYFKKGIHDIGVFHLPKHIKNVYFEDGSWVYGSLIIEGNSNVKIYGRGVLSSARMNYRQTHSLEAKKGSNNITIDGLVVADPKYFAVRLIGTNNHISYTKVIGGWTYNSDGISAFKGSRVKKSFIWANDDAIKIYRGNIVWEDIVVWQLNNGGVIQTSWGGAVGGSSSVGDTIRRLDVLRAEWNESRGSYFNCGLLNMVGNRYEGDGRKDSLDNWLIEDVRTETAIPLVFNLDPHTYTLAQIEGMRLKNWRVLMQQGTQFKNTFSGHGANPFSGFVFDSVYFNGSLLENRNYISTGTMNKNGWSAAPKLSNQYLRLLEGEGKDGTEGLKSVVTDMGGTSDYSIRSNEKFPLKKDQLLTISYWAKTASGTRRVVPWIQESDSQKWMNLGDHELSTSWKYFSETVTVSTLSSNNYQLKFRGYEKGTLFLDNVQIGPPNWKSVLDAEVVHMDTPVFNPSHHTPVINSSAPTSATEDSLWSYNVSATDADDDPLRYSLKNAPTGMTIVDNVINWTPTKGVFSSGEVTLTVADAHSFASEFFTVAVVPKDWVVFSQQDDSRKISSSPFTITPSTIDSRAKYVNLMIPPELSGYWKLIASDIQGNILDETEFEAIGGMTYTWNLNTQYISQMAKGSYIMIGQVTDKNGKTKIFRKRVGVRE